MNLTCTILGLWCSFSGPATAIDGDTLQVSGIRVRLWGIDAPEWNEPYGHEATQSLTEALKTGPIKCVDTGSRSYERRVMKCDLVQPFPLLPVDLGELQVKSGHALDCFRYSSGYYRKFEPPTIRTRITQKPYC